MNYSLRNFVNILPLLPIFNLPDITGVVDTPQQQKESFGTKIKNYYDKWSLNKYGLLNAGISGAADLAGNLINSNGLSSTAGNIMSGIGNIAGNIPGPIGWAGKGLALAGQAVNALWGHKFNDANVAAAESANRERNNWQFGDYSNTDALLAGSMANVLLGNVSKGFLGKEGPFSNAVTNKMNLINNDRMQANLRANNSELNAYNNYLTGMVRNAIAGDSMGNVNAAAYGGLFNVFGNGGRTHGSLFNNGFIEVNNGGSHELNPNQGILYGVDPQGTPNMVEEGETILDDYVFSDRIKFPKRYKSEFGLGGKLKNASFADISKKIAKESEERPNDPISQLTLKVMENKLANIQEEVKAKLALDKMDPREVMAMLLQLAMMQQGGQPQIEEQLMMQDPYQQAMMMDLPMMASCGGKLHANGGIADLFTDLDLAYINAVDPYDLTAIPDFKNYIAPTASSPYPYAVNLNNKNVTSNYVPVQNKRTWADFVDKNGNALYDVNTKKYTSGYLDPKFLEWAWDNPDVNYWSNPDNHVNWDKDNPKALPTNEDIFGSRGKANGLGFDKKLGDLHWYMLHLYNKWLDSNGNKTDNNLPDNNGSIDNKDPNAKPTEIDRSKYKKGIKYFIEDKDANGTPFKKEIEYNADKFAQLYPGYSFLREDDKIFDDDDKTEYQQYIYGKKPTNDFEYEEKPTYMRFAAPVALGIMSALDTAGLTNNADYSIANSLHESLHSGYLPVRSHPINDPYVYMPENYNFYNANLNNQYAGRQRAAGNMFANNIGTYIAGSAAINNALELARAEGMYNLKKQDLERLREIGGLKTAIAQANQTTSLDAQKANQAALADTFKRNAENLRALAELRYRIKKDSDEAKSSNMSEFLLSLADIGTENMNWNWRNWAIAHGVFGPMKDAPSEDVFYTKTKPKNNKTVG